MPQSPNHNLAHICITKNTIPVSIVKPRLHLMLHQFFIKLTRFVTYDFKLFPHHSTVCKKLFYYMMWQ